MEPSIVSKLAMLNIAGENMSSLDNRITHTIEFYPGGSKKSENEYIDGVLQSRITWYPQKGNEPQYKESENFYNGGILIRRTVWYNKPPVSSSLTPQPAQYIQLVQYEQTTNKNGIAHCTSYAEIKRETENERKTDEFSVSIDLPQKNIVPNQWRLRHAENCAFDESYVRIHSLMIEPHLRGPFMC